MVHTKALSLTTLFILVTFKRFDACFGINKTVHLQQKKNSFQFCDLLRNMLSQRIEYGKFVDFKQ